MSGISGTGSIAGHSSYQSGFAGSRSIAEEQSPALAECLFCGIERSKTQCGSGEVAPSISLQALASIHPCGVGMA